MLICLDYENPVVENGIAKGIEKVFYTGEEKVLLIYIIEYGKINNAIFH